MNKILISLFLLMCASGIAFTDDSDFSFLELKKACDADSKSEKCQQLVKEANQKCAKNSDSFACKKLYKAEVEKCKSNPETNFCKEFMSKN